MQRQFPTLDFQKNGWIKNAGLLLLFFCLSLNIVSAQQEEPIMKWWNPVDNEFTVLDGQGWSDGLKAPYDRFPARAEELVRPPVWSLSRHTAGMLLRFTSDAPEITVRYVSKGRKEYGFPHMPATGVSGVDLYGLDLNGNWLWGVGKYSFKDTITYRFLHLDKQPLKEYRLYLPLYNSVEWLEIGVPVGSSFKPLPKRTEKPVVVYGTSILQGACASRPGLVWTSIVERNLNTPFINLGFSGNGWLDEEVIDLLTELDAKLFILDNLPNLGRFSDEEVNHKIISSVKKIRAKYPNTPILFSEHPDADIHAVNSFYQSSYKRLNKVLRTTFDQMQKEGVKNIYMLTASEIGFDSESVVDGTHPNDIGMKQYATAYEKIIKSIFQTL